MLHFNDKIPVFTQQQKKGNLVANKEEQRLCEDEM